MEKGTDGTEKRRGAAKGLNKSSLRPQWPEVGRQGEVASRGRWRRMETALKIVLA